MNTLMMKRILSVSFALLLTAGIARASFEEIGTGPRAAAMGGAYVAQGDDVNGMFYNPASLAGVNRPELFASYEKMFVGLTDGSSIGSQVLGFGYPFSKSVIGVGRISLSLDSLYTESTNMLAYARPIGQNKRIGFAVRMLGITYGSDEYTKENPTLSSAAGASGMGFDFGMISVGKRMNWGVAIINANQPSVAIKYPNPVDRIIHLGVSLKRRLVTWNNSFLYMTSGMRLKTGMEYRPEKSPYALRAGFNMGSNSYRNLTMGAGYNTGSFRIDYAFELPLSGISGTMGNHQFGLTYRWGRERFPLAASEAEEAAEAEKTGPQTAGGPGMPGGFGMGAGAAGAGGSGAGSGAGGGVAASSMTAGGSLGEVTATPKPPTEEEKRAAAEALQKAKNAILNRGNYAQGMQEINKADAQLLGSRELKEMETLKLKMEPVAKIFRNLTGSDKRTRILRRAVDKYIADDGKSAFDAVTYAQQLWPEDRDIQQLKKVVDREFPQIASQEALVPNLSLVDQRLQEALELIYVGRYVAAISLCQDVLELEPNNVMALTRIGSAYWAMGYEDAARKTWRRALALDPSNTDLKQFLSREGKGKSGKGQ